MSLACFTNLDQCFNTLRSVFQRKLIVVSRLSFVSWSMSSPKISKFSKQEFIAFFGGGGEKISISCNFYRFHKTKY